MSIREIVGSETYERVRTLLRGVHPDPREANDDGCVDALIVALWRNYQPQYRALGLAPPPGDFPLAPPPAGAPSAIRTYLALATHARVRRPGSVFTGHLPMARVALPPKPVPGAVVPTPIGNVDFDADHLLRSIDEVAAYGQNEGYDFNAARVDVVTPPRQTDGRRFAAISVFLGYRGAADAMPSFYILEAGLAGGGPRVLYPAASIADTISFPSGYRPTPFADPNHWYTGQLIMDGDDPKHLHVDVSFGKNGDDYVMVDVEFAKQALSEYDPRAIYAEAALRVLAIAQALDVPVPDVGNTERAIGGLAGTLGYDWLRSP